MNQNNKKKYTIKEIIKRIDGVYEGELPLDHQISGVSSIENNTPNKVTFAENEKFVKKAAEQADGLVLINKNFGETDIKNPLKVEDARFSYVKVAKLFAPIPYYKPGINESAVIEASVNLGDNVSIHSNTYIGENSEIGDNVVIAPGVKIAENAKIGANTVLHPNVVIERDCKLGSNVIIEAGTVIGSEGYGYITREGKHYHIPQLGNVIIEDNVEIGASVTIDRGTQSATTIGKGTKIDNQVQVGHNVKIGKYCLLIGQVGIGGSTVLGDNVIVAGQSGIADHVKLGDNVKVGAGSIVTSDITADSFYLGNPAQDRMKELKVRVLRKKLPEYWKEIKNLKKS
jgi:UDP-3-O-[3-hydroxymyristoyl] glucosamine N-acyltransferase